MSAQIREALLFIEELIKEYTELTIIIGFCLLILLFVLFRPKAKKEEVKPPQVEKIRLEDDENMAVVLEIEKIEKMYDDLVKEQEKRESDEADKTKEKPVEPIASQTTEIQTAAVLDKSLGTQLENLAMDACGNKDRLKAIEIKIEKAEIVFRYSDGEEKKKIIQEVENSIAEETSGESLEVISIKDTAGEMEVQTEKKCKKFGIDNFNTTHSGRVFSETELDELIKA